MTDITNTQDTLETPAVPAPVTPPVPIPAAVATAVGISPETPAADKHTMQMRQLAAKEKQLREFEASIKARDAEHTAWQKEQAAWKQKHEQAKTDPDVLLSEMGWDFDKYVKYRLNQNKLDPQDQASIKMREFEDKLNAVNARQAELDKQRDEEAKTRDDAIKQQNRSTAITAVDDFLKGNDGKYELTATYGWAETVLDLFAQEHQNGMTLEEAAQKVETHLEGETKKLFATKKYKTLLPKEEPVAPAGDTKIETIVKRPPTTTLTNKMTARTETVKPVDRSARVAEAVKLLRSQQ